MEMREIWVGIQGMRGMCGIGWECGKSGLEWGEKEWECGEWNWNRKNEIKAYKVFFVFTEIEKKKKEIIIIIKR